MSENSKRHNSVRTPQRNWDDATEQENPENRYSNSYDQNREDFSSSRQPRLEQSSEFNTYDQYNRGSGDDYPQSYTDWNNRNRAGQDYDWQGQSRRNRQYGRPRTSFGNESYNYGQSQYTNFGQDEYNPYLRETAYGGSQFGSRFQQPGYGYRESYPQSREHSGTQQFGNQYGQQYGSQQYGTQQYGTQQYGGQPYSGSYTPGRWNENTFRTHQSTDGNESRGTGSQYSQSQFGSNDSRNAWNSGPHRGKGPKGYQRSDDRIREDISDRFMEDGLLDASDINVQVEDNEVILSGNVDTREAKRRAEELCESIPGINNVENRLHITMDNERRYNSNTNSDSSKKRNTVATPAS